MKKLINSFLFGSMILIASCNLIDNSEDSTTVNSVNADQLLEATISQIAFNQTSMSGRTAGIFMDYLVKGDSKAFDAFNIEPDLFDNFWKNAYYTGSLASAKKLNEVAEMEANIDLMGISLILLAYEYNNVTNTFGDIPFNSALKGVSDITPYYDTQEDVYLGIINLLDEAIELLQNKGINNSLQEEDLIYNGDMVLWLKFAYGLKARTLLNIRNKGIGTDQEILNLLDNSFVNHTEQANFQFTNSAPNPLFTLEIERPSFVNLSGTFGDKLLSLNDPRFLKYTTGEIVSATSMAYEWFDPLTLQWTNEDSKLPLLSNTELLFMKAETKNHLDFSTSEVSTAIEEAISESMIENGLSTDDIDVQTYISTFSDLSGLSKNEIHERIMEQAYYAYYGYNFIQSWNNQRRTGIPNLVNSSIQPSTYNPSGTIPVRFLYPDSEFTLNSAELQKAMDRQNGALLDEDLWVFE